MHAKKMLKKHYIQIFYNYIQAKIWYNYSTSKARLNQGKNQYHSEVSVQ